MMQFNYFNFFLLNMHPWPGVSLVGVVTECIRPRGLRGP